MIDTDDKKSEDVKEHAYCIRCGRRLKSDENRLRGMGKICWEKSQTKKKVRLF